MQRATWSTVCWSSGVASAPRSSGAMASRSSSLRGRVSLRLFKNAGKNETLALHFWELELQLESVWMVVVVGFPGKWQGTSLGVDGDAAEEEEDWVVVRSIGDQEQDKAMLLSALPLYPCSEGFKGLQEGKSGKTIYMSPLILWHVEIYLTLI